MTIKQQGGVFGRNPTFNDVEVNTITADGNAFVEALGVNTTSLTSVSGFGFGSFNGSNGGGIVLQQNGTPKASIASFGNDQYIDAVGKTVIRTGATVTGAPVNVMEFQADRNVKMSAGNLIFLAGNGIDFSATSGTGTSELFDDYEEGTWTPTYLPASGSFDAITYNVQEGYYTKIGNMVNARLFMRIASLTKGAASGAVNIGGLPYAAANTRTIGTVWSTDFLVNNPSYCQPSGSQLFMYSRLTSNGSANTRLDVTDLDTSSTDNSVILSVNYQTA